MVLNAPVHLLTVGLTFELLSGSPGGLAKIGCQALQRASGSELCGEIEVYPGANR